MDNNFLLTYSYRHKGMCEIEYSWFKTEEDLLEDVKRMSEYLDSFEVEDAIELVNVREINID